MFPKINSYSETVVKRIMDLSDAVKKEIVGNVVYGKEVFPIFRLEVSALKRAKPVLLTAGIHGEEPASVYGALDFIEKKSFLYTGDFSFHVYPCINPWGFERGVRGNSKGIDLNRDFENKSEQETRILVNSLMGESYSFAWDMHETAPEYGETFDVVSEGFGYEKNPEGFYMYEMNVDKPKRIGHKIIERLNVPVCRDETIYKDINHNGVIWYPEDKRTEEFTGNTLDSFVLDNFTNHSFVVETPTSWGRGLRIKTHSDALCYALDEFQKKIYGKK